MIYQNYKTASSSSKTSQLQSIVNDPLMATFNISFAQQTQNSYQTVEAPMLDSEPIASLQHQPYLPFVDSVASLSQPHPPLQMLQRDPHESSTSHLEDLVVPNFRPATFPSEEECSGSGNGDMSEDLLASFKEFKSICQTLSEKLNAPQITHQAMFVQENDSMKQLVGQEVTMSHRLEQKETNADATLEVTGRFQEYSSTVEKLFGSQRVSEGYLKSLTIDAFGNAKERESKKRLLDSFQESSRGNDSMTQNGLAINASEKKAASPSSSILTQQEQRLQQEDYPPGSAVALFREQYFEKMLQKSSLKSEDQPLEREEQKQKMISNIESTTSLTSKTSDKRKPFNSVQKKYQDLLFNSKLPASSRKIFEAHAHALMASPPKPPTGLKKKLRTPSKSSNRSGSPDIPLLGQQSQRPSNTSLQKKKLAQTGVVGSMNKILQDNDGQEASYDIQNSQAEDQQIGYLHKVREQLEALSESKDYGVEGVLMSVKDIGALTISMHQLMTQRQEAAYQNEISNIFYCLVLLALRQACQIPTDNEHPQDSQIKSLQEQKEREVRDIQNKLLELKESHQLQIENYQSQIKELQIKLEETAQSASKAQSQTSAFSNLLRQKFLKSFEEKIKEIEAARVSEIDDLKYKHQNEMEKLRQDYETLFAKKGEAATQIQNKIKHVVQSQNVKSIEEFLQYRTSQILKEQQIATVSQLHPPSLSEEQMLDIYLEALVQVLKRRELDHFDLGQKLQQLSEKLTQSEILRQEIEKRISSCKTSIKLSCEQFSQDLVKAQSADKSTIVKRVNAFHLGLKQALSSIVTQSQPRISASSKMK